MRVPISWLKEYTKAPRDLTVLTDKLTMIGHMLDKKEVFKNETVIDLELRGNRSDCYSILGIAREVSAIFKTPLKSPSLHEKLKRVKQLKSCEIKIKTPLIKRVMAVTIKNVKIKPSPDWMVNRLAAYGIPSINNLVDATNYAMVETGQPMHAFDQDLLGKEIYIRLATKGEKLITFEGTTINLTNEDLIFANNKEPVSIAGAIGGRNHSITKNTRNVLLEAANYSRANIRRTCRRHGLFTEAGLRHEKELDPNFVEEGVRRFLQIIKENNWGEVAPLAFDYYPSPRKELILSLVLDNLSKMAGFEIDKKDILSHLGALNFRIIEKGAKGIKVACPTYRTDVTQEADLVEEVIRLVGYNKIPQNTLALKIPPLITPPFIEQEGLIRDAAVSLGFDEQISLSFVKEKDLSINQPIDSTSKTSVQPVIVANPPSPDFREMRMSLLPNLLGFTEKIKNERGNEAFLFEIGKIYFRQTNKYMEKGKLGLIYWKKEVSFFEFKGLVETLFKLINLENFKFEEKETNSLSRPQFTISINKKTFAFGGLAQKDTFYVEIDLDEILGQEKAQKVLLWPKFPPIIEDLSFTLLPETRVGEFIQLIKEVNSVIREVSLLDTYENTRTFRVIYQSQNKTLTDKKVEKLRRKIIHSAGQTFHAFLKE